MSEKYIGKGISRHDGYEKVTGQAKYVGDMKMSGMLYARLKTSTCAHGLIKKIDIEKAKNLPGVKAVITGKDANYKLGLYLIDRPIIAYEKVRYFGEVVAAVAAETEEIAEEAVRLIEVEYDELPVVQDVEEALKKTSPLVHEHLEEYNYMKGVFHPEAGTNVANHFKVKKGDIEEGFKKADIILENTYYQPQVMHMPIETHTSIAMWGHGDHIKIWTSAQSPYSVRDLFSVAFSIPKTNINVVVGFVGGGFGGKSGIHLEALVALLSKFSNGRPVQLKPTREEECSTLPCRQGLLAKLKTGVTKDGKIVAEHAEYLWDGGAYADYGVNVGRAGGYAGVGPYEIENVVVDSLTVYTNHVFGTAYRGFGHPEVFWAIERQRDLLAKKLNMDPLEFRLKNLLMKDSKTITGEIITENTGRVDKCLKLVAEKVGYGIKKTEEELRKEKETGIYKGKAITVLHKAPAMPTWSASSAIIQMNEDGTIRFNVGGIDFGQGTYTILRQIIAERLNIPIEKVHAVVETETDSAPYDWQTVASRMTVLAGNAVIDACDDLVEQIFEMGSIVLRATKHEIALGDECVYLKQNPFNKIEYKKIAIGYSYENGNSIGGPLIGRGKSIAQGLTNLDFETGQGRPALDWTFGAHGVEISVDSHTGDIKVDKIVTCIDVGKVMNEKLLKGQVIGGVIQGLGTVASEYIQYTNEGKLITKNLVDYKIPTMKDIPDKMEVFAVETPQLDGPYGARGCAEHPLIGITPLIANALANATGIEIYNLPLSQDNVYKYLKNL